MFLTIEALPNLGQRITRLAQVLSAVHRLYDGKPGKIWLEPKQTKSPGREARKEETDYAFTLPDEDGKEPVMFKIMPGDETNAEVTYCRENAANYRKAHEQLTTWAVQFESENQKLHPLQQSGVLLRLWKTPKGMKRTGLERVTPIKKRIIRDRD